MRDFRDGNLGQLLRDIELGAQWRARRSLGWDGYFRHVAEARATVISALHQSSFDVMDRSALQRSSLAVAGRSGLSATFTSGSSGTPLSIWRDELSEFDFLVGSYLDLFAELRAEGGALAQPLKAQDPVLCLSIRPNGTAWSRILPDAPPRSLIFIPLTGLPNEDARRVCDVAPPRCLAVFARPSVHRYLWSALGASSRLEADFAITGGERLHDDVAESLRTRVTHGVIDLYSSQEAGTCAWRHASEAAFRPFGDRARMEVLSEEGVSASGFGRLVVTSRSNWTMPIVRYLTDDQVALSQDRADRFSATIFGRDHAAFQIGNRFITDTQLAQQVRRGVDNAFRVRQREGAVLSLRILEPSSDLHSDLEQRVRQAFGSDFGNIRLAFDLFWPPTEAKERRFERLDSCIS